MLFNLAYEKVVRNAVIQTNGTMFYKSVQLLAHVDDIDVIAISQTALKEAFVSLEKVAGQFGLMINEVKNKYLTERVNRNQPKHYKIENLILKRYRFLHMWTLL